MTSDALVKSVLTGELCELYDRVRIKNLFKNLSLGYGKLEIYEDHITITYLGGKSRKIVYNIHKKILTPEQINTF